jgi:hypothetical protein
MTREFEREMKRNTKMKKILVATYEGSVSGFGVIPATDPYLGTTTVKGSLPETMVDWVLVELRSTASGATVAQAVGCLLADGSVTDTTGVNGLSFVGLESSSAYYIVVKHRNHLAIMSSSAVSIDESNTEDYDFTVSGAAYGGDVLAVKQVGSDYAMIAGDGDGNTQIQISDKTAWNTQSGLSGYNSADYDMNGFVQTNDVSFYYGSSGSASQVPVQP